MISNNEIISIINNKAFGHVETLFIQGRNLAQNLFTIYTYVKEICEWTGVNLFDYVNSKEVLYKISTLDE